MRSTDTGSVGAGKAGVAAVAVIHALHRREVGGAGEGWRSGGSCQSCAPPTRGRWGREGLAR
jgi:hypothetical protein